MHEHEEMKKGPSYTTHLHKSEQNNKYRKFIDLLQKIHYHYIRKPHLWKKR